MWIVHRGPEHEELAALARGALSQRFHAHYAGFARSQIAAARASAAPTAKRLLYVLRTTLTGSHLLETGELITDLTVIMDDRGFGHARERLDIKREGERTPLPPEVAARWLGEVERVFEVLERARERSVLPVEPTNGAALEAWLIELRRRRFDG